MRVYYYLLFRIYMFYKKYEKTDFTLSTSFLSTVLVSVNLITIYLFLNFYDIISQFPNKITIVIFMISIWAVNYYFIVKKEDFLNKNFEKDRKGGFIVVGYIVLTITLAFLIAKLNRDKILG